MNLLHLKYAVEVAATHSMTKAAEKLYTSQPNLSRAIKGLEESLGIEIFKRTSKGIYPTSQGEEFLGYARKVLDQVDSIQNMFRGGQPHFQQFSISVPRSCYVSCAFTHFTSKLPPEEAVEIFYQETSSAHVIENILEADYRLGIMRYPADEEEAVKEMLAEKKLNSELVFEFAYQLLMSKKHPLAAKGNIVLSDLTPYVEIAHANPFVPSMPLSTVRKNQLTDKISRHIYVFERGTQMDILAESPDVFLWASPVPEHILCRYDLVQRDCRENRNKFRDVLVYRNDYKLTELDKLFIDELIKVKRQLV